MDDYRPFRGSAHLDQVHARRDSGDLTEEDKTFLMLMELSGLNFEDEVARSTDADREQRMLDMNDASLALTRLLASHWSQRKYEVRLSADGNHIIAFVSDIVQPALVPLDERSRGFQWFFSFDTMFLYETQGTFKNAIILLDEPGLHLHGDAQRDLLARIKEYAKENQIIYTTHLPLMLDLARSDNIRFCIEREGAGTIVSDNAFSVDKPTLSPLLQNIGMSTWQNIFLGPCNLVVEGVTDYWFLSAMSHILQSEGKLSLDERSAITWSGGATRAAYIATILKGQDLGVVVLLDSDSEGQAASDKLIKDWIMPERRVLLLGRVLECNREMTLEDLFTDEFYLKYVNESYNRELEGNPLKIGEVRRIKQPQLIRRLDALLKSRGVKPNSKGWALNKGRIAKVMTRRLVECTLKDLPSTTVKGFELLFESINQSMTSSGDGAMS